MRTLTNERATSRRRYRIAIYGAVIVFCVTPALVAFAGAVPDDAALMRAIGADSTLRACRCVMHAGWIDQSYPRVVVDARRFAALGEAARARFTVRALEVAEGVYAREWGTPDIYPQLYVVDANGKQLAFYRARHG